MISLSLIFIPSYYVVYENEIRFSGLLLSPTVFGIYSLIYFVTFLRFSDKNEVFGKIFLYAILIVLLFAAKSRLNIFIALLLPFYFSLIGKEIFFKHKRKLFIFILFSSIFMYPVYELTKDTMIETRRNASDSDNTRLGYTVILVKEIQEASFIKKMFGNKANSSLKLIGNNSIKPHNDFLRIIYDYGIIFFILYLFVIYYYFKRDYFLSFIIVIYLASFYHNMIFDLFMITYLIFMSFIVKQNSNYTLS